MLYLNPLIRSERLPKLMRVDKRFSTKPYMQRLVLKLLYVATRVKHSDVPKKYRNYIRDNYYSRLLQANYYYKDYISKKNYKVISYRGEFQQELTFVLPFAYWHYLNGTLHQTISCTHTKELYFFSKNHVEYYTERDWMHDEQYEIPNMTHNKDFSYKKWARVPLKETYRNDIFVFDKPLLIIANKYNTEWEHSPLNYFNKKILEKIFLTYGDKYQIIYNRPSIKEIVPDNSAILNLDEFQWIRDNFPGVLILSDLMPSDNTIVNNFNHLQLMVYANCSRFISVHGGTSALASYFGGINVILSKSGIEHYFKEFETIFPELSGAKILHATTEEKMFNYLKEHY